MRFPHPYDDDRIILNLEYIASKKLSHFMLLRSHEEQKRYKCTNIRVKTLGHDSLPFQTRGPSGINPQRSR